MSVAGISSTNLYQPSSVNTTSQSRRSEFQQLGQDLQAENLEAAQQDFSQLIQVAPKTSSSVQSASVNPQVSAFKSIAQDLNTLGQSLQSGNLSAAQQAYSKVQQDMQGVQKIHGHSHHHHGSTSTTTTAPSTTGALAGTTGTSLLNLLSSSMAHASSLGMELLSTGLSAMA